MSEEEKKAIEILKSVRIGLINFNEITEEYKKVIISIQTIVNLIEKQQKQNDFKDKVIDEMAKAVYDYANLGTMGICPAELENGCINFDLCEYFGKKDINCLKCVKLYFIDKVKENKE